MPGCRIRSSGRPPSTEHRAATATTLDSVGILPPSPINLFSAGAPIPVWVRNDLPYPVNVVLYATPDDLRLDVAKATEATAGPQSNTRVQVPVQSRVGNGEVTVQLQLRSRTLEPIGAPQAVAVNVRADWEGVGIVILSLLVGGFILLGVVRTVLSCARAASAAQTAGCRGRRGDRRAAADAEAMQPTDAAAESPPARRRSRPKRARIGRERHRAGERADRRRHDRLAADRVPARRRARLRRRCDHGGRQRLRDREPAAEQHLRDHLHRPADAP